MKTSFVRQCSLGLAVGLVFTLGCARPKAQEPTAAGPAPLATPVLVAQATPAPANAPASAPADANAAIAATNSAAQGTNAPAILERIPPTTQTAEVEMSPGMAEVVKLAQAGVGEEVILAYIEKYSAKFDLGAEQIVYLNDLGVSSAVMTAMLKHDGRPESDLAALAGANAPPATSPGLPATTSPPVVTAPLTPQPEQVPAQVATAVAPPPTANEVAYFYDALSPYGSWVYLSGYGWCWQPTVAVSVPTWRPYLDRGRWYWSDGGWYWHSDYSWGWAAFHYGRWYHHAGSGWVWRPGLDWGPAWVSWRYYDGYCGWAPLPPEAHFVYGSGFTYYGSSVAVSFDFGLAPYHYSFISVNNFYDYSPYRYVVPRTQVNNFYRHTTVVNNYHVDRNRHVINHGIGRETIARASTTRVREVSIRENAVSDVSRIRGDRIGREGNQLVVYRPQLPKDPPRVRSAQFTQRTGTATQTGTSVGRSGRTTGTANLRDDANVNKPATVGTRGETRTDTGRGQNTVATRPERRDDATRPQPGTEERKPVTNQRGNPPRTERSKPDDSKPVVTAPQQPRRQNEPVTRSPAPQQTAPGRGNTPLFGDGGNAPARPQNNVTATRPADRTPPTVKPKVDSVPQPNVPAARVQPQTPAQPRYTPQVEPRGQGAGRSYSEQPSMPPRQYEQVPRYTAPMTPTYRAPAPAYQAPHVSPQPSHPAAGRGYSAPQSAPAEHAVRSAPSGGGGERERAVSRGEGAARGGGGGGRGDGGGGGGRGERNR